MKSFEEILQQTDSYKLDFEHRDEYLYAFVGEGTDSLSVSKDFWLKILTEAQKQRYRKVLIEEDLNGMIAFTELYELAVWLSNLQFENILVGFVDRHPEHQEQNKFGELIATNRGFRVGVFDSIEQAEKYLKSR